MATGNTLHPNSIFAISIFVTFILSGQAAWLPWPTNTPATLKWEDIVASFGTMPPVTGPTKPWWIFTSTTAVPTVSTIPTTLDFVTTPPPDPEIITSTDGMYLGIMLGCLVVGIICGVLICVVSFKILTAKKHKKTHRLKVKPLKANQAFAPVMHPGMALGMGDAMAMSMPGMMAPLDTMQMNMDGAMMGGMGGMGLDGGMAGMGMDGGMTGMGMDGGMGMDPSMMGMDPSAMGGMVGMGGPMDGNAYPGMGGMNGFV